MFNTLKVNNELLSSSSYMILIFWHKIIVSYCFPLQGLIPLPFYHNLIFLSSSNIFVISLIDFFI
ncbi:hypothetical protein BHY_1327 (plasmid) [Borrelia nietonii YOR]|uniref:Uncharacterized protein n=2 Tax=Borrelia TaxID=138 RepID=W5SC67_9SPIR|nr:hypothetical protein BHY_1327 [Borrelia nietonii YOR]AHH14688.1 hypothetical protein BHW_0900043 [Borrelia hermsii MTW]